MEDRLKMNTSPEPHNAGGSAQLKWYVYDRQANLLHIAPSLQDAEAWAFDHWEVAEIGDREEVAANDYYYLLFAAKPPPGEFHTRDFQARIVRHDRVIALGRDPDAVPRYPD
jgi:hypothetical protein